MKNLISLIFATILSVSMYSQDINDIYKKGEINLITDTDFANDNNWDKIFESYNVFIYHKALGKKKSILVNPDGSIVVSHASRNYYSLFSPQGKFIKEFGVTKKTGKKNGNGIPLRLLRFKLQ